MTTIKRDGYNAIVLSSGSSPPQQLIEDKIMPAQKTSVTLDPRILEEIDRRTEYDSEGSRSAVISRHMERYFSMLQRGRANLRERLTDNEAMLIVDVLNGVAFWDTFGIYLVHHEVADGIQMDGLDKKWEVDGKALIGKLVDMNDAQRIALVDSVTLWWNRVAQGEQPGRTVADIFGDPPRKNSV